MVVQMGSEEGQNASCRGAVGVLFLRSGGDVAAIFAVVYWKTPTPSDKNFASGDMAVTAGCLGVAPGSKIHAHG
jgi:hypothetical protein